MAGEVNPEPREAPDGTRWLHFPDLDGGLWTGWQPGEAGTWNLSEEEFRAAYPVPDKVHAGGLMRCCLQTLEEYYPDGPAVKAAEGEVLPCKYCDSSVIFRAGYWEWNHD